MVDVNALKDTFKLINGYLIYASRHNYRNNYGSAQECIEDAMEVIKNSLQVIKKMEDKDGKII